MTKWGQRHRDWATYRPCPARQFVEELAEVERVERVEAQSRLAWARRRAEVAVRSPPAPLDPWERLWVEWKGRRGPGGDYFPAWGWVGSSLGCVAISGRDALTQPHG